MDIYVLDNELTRVRTVATSSECLSATEELELGKAGQLTLSLPISYKDTVKEMNIIAIHDRDDRYRLYTVTNRNLNNYTLDITGVSYANYALSRVGYVKDLRPDNRPLTELIPQVLGNSGWNLNHVDENIPGYTGSFYYISRLEALSQISESLACEFDFYVTIGNNAITGQYVDVVEMLGEDTDKRFEYGTNALEVVAEYDATEVYTQAIGRGKGEETGDGYGRRIEFTDIVWSTANGDPVDKPAGQNWVNDPYQNYQLPGNKRPAKIIEFEEITDPSVLLEETYKWLLENNHPKVQFKAKVVQTGSLNLGDRVQIVRPDLDIRYETRVFKLTRNLLDENLTELEFGDNIATTPMDKLNSMTTQIDSTNNAIQRVEEQVSQINAEGNRITYGSDEPLVKKKGDMWYKTTPDGDTELYIWNGEAWELTIGDAIFEDLEQQIADAQQDASDAKQQADSARQDASNAIDKATQVEQNFDTEIAGIKEDIVNIDTALGEVQIDVSNANDNASQALITAQGIQTTVSNMKFGAVNILRDTQTMENTDFWNNNSVTLSNGEYAAQTVWKSMRYQLPKLYEALDNTDYLNKEFVLSFDIFVDEEATIPNNTELSIYSDGIFDRKNFVTKINDLERGKWLRLSKVITATNTNSGNYFRVEFNQTVSGGFVRFKRFKLEKGNIPTAWNPAPQDVDYKFTQVTQTADGLQTQINNQERQINTVTQTANTALTNIQDLERETETKFLQTDEKFALQAKKNEELEGELSVANDNINLSVKKNDIINQINISTEEVLIDGNKVHITGQTTIDNGVIKDAMIGNLSASKLTSGTIDASKINVINMDVNKLTGNKAQFLQAAFKSANSTTGIDADGLYTKNDHMSTVLGSGVLQFRDKGGHLTGELSTGDWLEANGYDDTLIINILGRRQLSIGFSSDENNLLINEGIRIKQRDIGTDSNQTLIQFPNNCYLENIAGYQLHFGAYGGDNMEHSPLLARIDPDSGYINTGVAFGKNALMFFDGEGDHMTLNDIRLGRLQGLRTPNNDYPIKIVDSTINGNQALALRSSEGGNGVVINNANVKIYAKTDLIFEDGYAGKMTLNEIKRGKLSNITFPDGRLLTLKSGTMDGAGAGFITGTNDVGIAWTGGDLYFGNAYHGWIKFEDILKKIGW